MRVDPSTKSGGASAKVSQQPRSGLTHCEVLTGCLATLTHNSTSFLGKELSLSVEFTLMPITNIQEHASYAPTEAPAYHHVCLADARNDWCMTGRMEVR